jgi:hypothetical protein
MTPLGFLKVKNEKMVASKKKSPSPQTPEAAPVTINAISVLNLASNVTLHE